MYESKLATVCIAIFNAADALETAESPSEDIKPRGNEQEALQTVPEPSVTRFNVTEDNTISRQNSDMMHDGAPVTNFHDRDWLWRNVTLQIRGYVASRKWNVIGLSNEMISHGRRPPRMHPLDFFAWSLPQKFLSYLVTYTNAEPIHRDLRVTSRGEILKALGILVLVTRYEFSARSSLWSQKQTSKYLAPPMFGNITLRQRWKIFHKSYRFPHAVTLRKLIDGCVARNLQMPSMSIAGLRTSHLAAFRLMKACHDGVDFGGIG